MKQTFTDNNNLKGYDYEVDAVDQNAWADLLDLFDDATIYQTWQYGSVRWRAKNISRIIIKKDDSVCAMAQLRILKIPLIQAGIAYLTWGPVWKRKGQKMKMATVKATLSALIQAYCVQRKLLLRIHPNIIDSAKNSLEIIKAFLDEGFIWQKYHYRTVLVDLSQSEDELKAHLKKHCAKKIKAAQKHEAQIISGTSHQDFMNVLIPYRDMIKRKNLNPGIDIDEFVRMQSSLPDRHKLLAMYCKHDHKIISSIFASVIGEKGIIIAGGSDPQGLKAGKAISMPWELLLEMKRRGLKCADLGGYNPGANPGTAFFKQGYGGTDVLHIGEYEYTCSALNTFLLHAAESIRDLFSILKK